KTSACKLGDSCALRAGLQNSRLGYRSSGAAYVEADVPGPTDRCSPPPGSNHLAPQADRAAGHPVPWLDRYNPERPVQTERRREGGNRVQDHATIARIGSRCQGPLDQQSAESAASRQRSNVQSSQLARILPVGSKSDAADELAGGFR